MINLTNLGTISSSEGSEILTPFEFVFNTIEATNYGAPDPLTLYLPLDAAGTYNFNVDWGDGSPIENIPSYAYHSANPHVYAVDGIYTVSILGTIRGWTMYTSLPADTINFGITDVTQWGCLRFTKIQVGHFSAAPNLINITATDTPNFKGCTSMFSFFDGCLNLINVNNINLWNVSGITNMGRTFQYSSFNQDISGWNTSNVISMSNMFEGCTSFNQPLNSWNTSKVTSMISVFDGCILFNQPLNNWNVSFVTRFSYMFRGCTAFNSSIDGWNMPNTTNALSHNSMFEGCTSFNQPLNNWVFASATTKTLSLQYMFLGCTAFNQPLSNWNLSRAGITYEMFKDCVSFNQDLSTWNVSRVLSFQYMFENCTSFNSPIFTVTNFPAYFSAKSMQYMFGGCTSFNQDVSGWDMTLVVDLSGMFSDCIAFNQDLSSWVVSGITNTMLVNCTSFNSPVFNLSSVQDASGMFLNCTSFNQLISSPLLSLINGSYMFSGCTSFNQPLYLMSLYYNPTIPEIDISFMFENCTALDQTLSGFLPYTDIDGEQASIYATGFMSGKTFNDYSSANYDDFFGSYADMPFPTFIILDQLDMGTIKYTAAQQANRDIMTNTYGWIINDGGVVI